MISKTLITNIRSKNGDDIDLNSYYQNTYTYQSYTHKL